MKISSAASELGVAASTWSHWECGRRFPSGALLLGIITYTGIPLVELVCKSAQNCPLRACQKKTQDGKTQDASPEPGASMEQAVTWAKLLRREEQM